MAKADIAALLALASALCVAIGDVLQQRARHRITDTSVGQLEPFRRLLGDRRWRWGAVMLVVSIGLQAAASSSRGSTPARRGTGSRRGSDTWRPGRRYPIAVLPTALP